MEHGKERNVAEQSTSEQSTSEHVRLLRTAHIKETTQQRS